MNDDYREQDIKPLVNPGHATRLALMLAYRNGLRTSPAAAWADALAIAGERFPLVEKPRLERMLLFCLGLFGMDAKERLRCSEPPNPEGGLPFLIRGEIGMRLQVAAQHYGLTTEELVSRVLSAWMEAACDVDGIPGEGIQAPPPLR